MIPKQTLTDFPVFADNGTKVSPDSAKYAEGYIASEVLPAEHLNYFLNKASDATTNLNEGVESMEEELVNVVSAAGYEPSKSTNNQVHNAIKAIINAITGTLTNLTTSVKTTLVAAINELNASKSPLAGSSSLTTCSQGTFAAAATKGVDTAVTSGSANLPTSGAVASALAYYALNGVTVLDSDESNFWSNRVMKVFRQSSWGTATTNFPFSFGVYFVYPSADMVNLNIIGCDHATATFKFGHANIASKTITWTDYATTTDLSSYAPLFKPAFTRTNESHDGGEIQLQRADPSKINILLNIYDDVFRIFSSEGTGFFINFAAKTAGVWDKNFADAAFKGIDTAVTSGSANLPTSDAVASALAANFACTYISINGGADIGANQRYVIDNPYPDYEIACSVEIYYGGKWGSINNSIFNNDSGGYGVMANTWGTQIVVQTGNIAIVGDSITSCNPFNTAAGAPIYTAPCRVKVWKVGPKVS